MATDSELRAISSVAPAEWWSMPTAQLSVDHVLQYWHQYFTIRTHLATAMRSSQGNQSDQYVYSRSRNNRSQPFCRSPLHPAPRQTTPRLLRRPDPRPPGPDRHRLPPTLHLQPQRIAAAQTRLHQRRRSRPRAPSDGADGSRGQTAHRRRRAAGLESAEVDAGPLCESAGYGARGR